VPTHPAGPDVASLSAEVLGTLHGMAALREALQTPAQGARPPHLRPAARAARSCGSCRYFKALGLVEGACRLYAGARVKSGQECDAWKAP